MTKLTLRQRFGIALAVGVAGGAVAIAISHAGGAVMRDWGFVRVATGGAFLAGLLVAPGFGGAGARGWFMSGMTFGAATILGAIFAVLLLPFEEMLAGAGWPEGAQAVIRLSVMGPIYVVDIMTKNAGVIVGWLGALAAIQTMTYALRRKPNL